jgi:hypothetical protein
MWFIFGIQNDFFILFNKINSRITMALYLKLNLFRVGGCQFSSYLSFAKEYFAQLTNRSAAFHLFHSETCSSVPFSCLIKFILSAIILCLFVSNLRGKDTII